MLKIRLLVMRFSKNFGIGLVHYNYTIIYGFAIKEHVEKLNLKIFLYSVIHHLV
jgi:hypothetical protein